MLSRICIIILLILLSAFFAGSETALTGVNRIRLKHKSESANKREKRTAKKALKLLAMYDKTLATLLIGNNVVNLVAASVATLLAVSAALPGQEEMTVAIVTAIITVALIIFGEVLPKTLAREYSEKFVMATAGILTALFHLLTPVSALLLLLQRGVTRLFASKLGKEVSVTEEELIQIIDEIEGEGVLEDHESRLVRSALGFDETTVQEILTPRVDIAAVALTDSKEKIRDVFLSEGYSRLPVYDKTPDKIIGVISNKEFMKRLIQQEQEQGEEFTIHDIMQSIVKLPALLKLPEALKLMQRKKSHLAVVLDQYGGTEGIVTLEDILEELVGEIWDEDDEETPLFEFTSENVFETGSELNITDFNRYFDGKSLLPPNEDGDEQFLQIDSDCNSIGGWVLELFGRIPTVGESVSTDKLKVTVLSMDGRRIGRLRFEVIGASPQTPPGDF